MSNIKYNEQEEAFELPYKLWDETRIVRFYVESEDEIMQNLKGIAEKLAKLDGSRKQIAELLIDDGELIVCFDAGTNDGYMKNFVNIELFGDIFEITGWVT